MRPLEMTLVLVNMPLLLFCMTGRPPPTWLRAVPAFALLVLTLHVVFEGPRWHLAPAYIVTVIAFLWILWPYSASPDRWAAVCCIGCLAAATVIGTVLPVFAMPKPTGPFLVGTVTLHLIDERRWETQGQSPSGLRELMVQIWYPAEQDGPGKPYRTPAEAAFPKDHLAFVRTFAAECVPVAQKQSRYPILLFSPSWIGRRTQNTVQAVELASHGFCVVGVDHPFGTDLTIFPDGRQARTGLGHPLDFSTDDALASIIKTAEEQVRIRAADLHFVLDELEHRNERDPAGLLTGRLDVSRVGVFGHSFGGAVAAETCRIDPRVRAGANLDGFIYGDSLTKGFRRPFLILETATPCPTESDIAAAQGAVRRRLSFVAENTYAIESGLAYAGGYWVSVRGTSHMNFCDSPLYTPIRRLNHSGSISRERAFEIINTTLLDFFQHQLIGGTDDILASLPQRFHEVQFKRIAKSVP